MAAAAMTSQRLARPGQIFLIFTGKRPGAPEFCRELSNSSFQRRQKECEGGDAAKARRQAPSPKRQLQMCMSEIQNFGKDRQWRGALAVLARMQKSGPNPDVVAYCAVMNALTKAKVWTLSLLLFETMQQRRLNPTVSAYRMALSACEKEGSWLLASALLREMQEGWRLTPDLAISNVLISSMSKAGEWVHALGAFEELKKQNLHPDIYTFNSLTSACENGAQWNRALAFLADMSKQRIHSDVISYSAAISACDKASHWQGAVMLWEQMNKANVKPDVIANSALIGALSNGRQCSLALALIAKAEARSNRDWENYLSQAQQPLRKSNKWEQTSSSRNSNHGRSGDNNSNNNKNSNNNNNRPPYLPKPPAPPIDLPSFNAAAIACAKDRRWREALGLLRTISKVKLEPDAFVGNSILAACDSGDTWISSLALLAWMQRTSLADVVSYNTALHTLGQANEWEKSLDIFRSLKFQRVRPDIVTFNTAISVGLEGGLPWESASSWLDEARRNSLRLDEFTYGAVVTAFSKHFAWEHAVQTLREVRGLGLELDTPFYNATMTSAAQASRWVAVLEVFSMMLNGSSEIRDFTPPTERQKTTISRSVSAAAAAAAPTAKTATVPAALTKTPTPKLTPAATRSTPSPLHTPDMITYTTILQASSSSGLVWDLSKLLPRLRSLVLKDEMLLWPWAVRTFLFLQEENGFDTDPLLPRRGFQKLELELWQHLQLLPSVQAKQSLQNANNAATEEGPTPVELGAQIQSSNEFLGPGDLGMDLTKARSAAGSEALDDQSGFGVGRTRTMLASLHLAGCTELPSVPHQFCQPSSCQTPS